MPSMKRALSIGFKAVLVAGIAIDAVQLFREMKGLRSISHKMHDDYTCDETRCTCHHECTCHPENTENTEPTDGHEIESQVTPEPEEIKYTYPKDMIPTFGAAEAIRVIEEASHTDNPEPAIRGILQAIELYMTQPAAGCANERANQIISYAAHTNDPDGILLGVINTLKNYLAGKFPKD